MPYKKPEDRRQNWKNWYHRNKAEYDQNYAQYRQENRERIRQNGRIYHIRIRQQVIAHYGGKCACCGEDRLEFLTIDHVGGRGVGAEHRRALAKSGINSSFILWLRKHGYPEGYQVLCYNCNCASGIYGYCPHKDEGSRLAARIAIHEKALVRRIICERCGKTVETKSPKTRFCSRQCSTQAWRRRQKKVLVTKDISKCEYCGVEFRPRAHNTRFCCKPCAAKEWRRQHPERVKEYVANRYRRYQEERKAASRAMRAKERERNKVESITCRQCGKSFLPHSRSMRFCSASCRAKNWRRQEAERIVGGRGHA